MSAQGNEVRVLQLTLHRRLVGYLAGYQSGRNRLTFAEAFRTDPERPTLSLITHPAFPQAQTIMSTPWIRTQKLPPLLSNLLPEGALRELLAQRLKVHTDNEFQLLAHLGNDLPGALVATPIAPEQVPQELLNHYPKSRPVAFAEKPSANRFSLAGVQIKFSAKVTDERYNLTTEGELGDWIVKTPSTPHPDVPLNEYTAMRLAQLAGVTIPEIKLVDIRQLDNLPPINLPDEQQAFAIKRFDRDNGSRVHMEDFAQVFAKDALEKYDAANYEQIGRIVRQYSGDGLADVQQLARRLLANILLGNGDAHLKNWSLLYADQKTPRLSPAYDIVTTLAYMEGEQEFSLNLVGNKNWYRVTFNHFERWAEALSLPWRPIKAHLTDTLEKARALWPTALHELPMAPAHKVLLKQHWRTLAKDFQIIS